MESVGCHLERKKTLSEYITQKISMLEDEFIISLSCGEIAHMRDLQSEEAVDRFAHQILIDRL